MNGAGVAGRAVPVLGLALVGAALAAACGEKPAAPRDAAPPDAAPAPPEVVVRVLRGHAIWYGGRWHGRKTASGERFDEEAFTAAHRTLPLGTRVRVTDVQSGRQAIVRINDRGPYGRDRRRMVNVSEAVARELGFLERGSTRVVLEVLAPRPGAPGD